MNERLISDGRSGVRANPRQFDLSGLNMNAMDCT
jgi:hypothetical protein